MNYSKQYHLYIHDRLLVVEITHLQSSTCHIAINHERQNSDILKEVVEGNAYCYFVIFPQIYCGKKTKHDLLYGQPPKIYQDLKENWPVLTSM